MRRGCYTTPAMRAPAPMRLSPFNRRFVDEYVRNWSATKAWILAGGGSERAEHHGQDMLSDKAIRRAIDWKVAQLGRECEIDAKKAMRRLYAVATTRITDVIYNDFETGEIRIEVDDLTEDQQAAIESIKIDPKTGATSIKMVSPLRAIETLAKMLKWGPPPPPQMTVTVSAENAADAQEIYRQMLDGSGNLG